MTNHESDIFDKYLAEELREIDIAKKKRRNKRVKEKVVPLFFLVVIIIFSLFYFPREVIITPPEGAKLEEVVELDGLTLDSNTAYYINLSEIDVGKYKYILITSNTIIANLTQVNTYPVPLKRNEWMQASGLLILSLIFSVLFLFGFMVSSDLTTRDKIIKNLGTFFENTRLLKKRDENKDFLIKENIKLLKKVSEEFSMRDSSLEIDFNFLKPTVISIENISRIIDEGILPSLKRKANEKELNYVEEYLKEILLFLKKYDCYKELSNNLEYSWMRELDTLNEEASKIFNIDLLVPSEKKPNTISIFISKNIIKIVISIIILIIVGVIYVYCPDIRLFVITGFVGAVLAQLLQIIFSKK